MTYLSNPMFRSFVWNQPFMCCVAFNLQTIIKSQNRILFRGLEAAAMALRIGCDICAIRLLHTQLFLSPLPQCNVWKLPDEADLSGMQCEGVRWDHESFQLSISFVSHVWQKLRIIAFIITLHIISIVLWNKSFSLWGSSSTQSWCCTYHALFSALKKSFAAEQRYFSSLLNLC